MREYERHAIITGHYLGYTGSYAEAMDLPPEKTGSPIINLHGDSHTIRVLT